VPVRGASRVKRQQRVNDQVRSGVLRRRFRSSKPFAEFTFGGTAPVGPSR
jgi:hypothetical protein